MASATHKPSERFTLEPLISNQSVRISGSATTSSFDKNAINASTPAARPRLRVKRERGERREQGAQQRGSSAEPQRGPC